MANCAALVRPQPDKSQVQLRKDSVFSKVLKISCAKDKRLTRKVPGKVLSRPTGRLVFQA